MCVGMSCVSTACLMCSSIIVSLAHCEVPFTNLSPCSVHPVWCCTCVAQVRTGSLSSDGLFIYIYMYISIYMLIYIYIYILIYI